MDRLANRNDEWSKQVMALMATAYVVAPSCLIVTFSCITLTTIHAPTHPTQVANGTESEPPLVGGVIHAAHCCREPCPGAPNRCAHAVPPRHGCRGQGTRGDAKPVPTPPKTSLLCTHSLPRIHTPSYRRMLRLRGVKAP